MSTHPTMRSSAGVLAPLASRAGNQELAIGGLSITGLILFVASSLVLGSGFSALRPSVFGLLVHPYLIPVAIAFPFAVMSRLGEFPARILAALVVFVGFYCFSIINGLSFPLNEIFKIGASLVTIITFALLVRRRGDFVAGTLGMSVAMAVLVVPALGAPERAGGLQIIDVANKNSYSMYALPGMLLAGYIVLKFKIPVVFKAIFIVSSMMALVAIFMTGNRSGYLGAVLVGFMLLWEQRAKGLLLVGGIAAGVVYWILQYGSTEILHERLRATVEDSGSDAIRLELIRICLEIGLQNPVIGVSPQMLPFEIGRRATWWEGVRFSEAHNVFAHIIGGSGLICFAALLVLGWTLCSWNVQNGKSAGVKQDPLREARRLMRMLVVLWVVRGMFTAEIIYNPSFNMAIGLVIGLCVLAQRAERAELAVGSKALTTGGPASLAAAR